jgi:hypothetical protein
MMTIWICPAWGGDYDVMLDASGSMRGFKKEPAWQKLLENLESSARRKYQFGNRNNFKRVEAPLINVRLRDQKTFLGEALKDWLTLSSRGDVVVIITDNVADNTNNSSQSQRLFYDLLSKPGSPFSHIAIFPMRLPFNGKVFPIGPGKGKPYKGDRALSIYAIGRKISATKFDNLRDQIKTKITGFKYEYIQVKPFDSKSISSVGKIKIDTSSTQGAKIEPVVDDNGKERLVISRLYLGSEMEFSFNVTVQSSSSFDLHDVELTANLQLNKSEDTRHITMEENFITEVQPRRATISATGIQDILITFENKPFQFGDLDFLDKLAFTWHNTLLIHGEIDIEFKANRDNMEVAEQIKDTWSYEGSANNLASASVQQKVYKLGDLVKSMLSEAKTIEKLHSTPVTLELRYPLWPLLVIIMAFLLLVGFLYWVMNMRTPKVYQLEDDMGYKTDITMGLGQPYRHYSHGQLLFALSSWGIGFWVNTSLRLRSSHFIGSGQKIRIEIPDTGEEYNWRLRELKLKARKEEPTGDENGLW